MDARERLTDFVKALPVAHRVMIGAALVGLGLASVMFLKWVTTPSYTVLYSGLDDKAVATTIDELEAAGVPYKLEAGGKTVMVPREKLYATRAQLAGAGLTGTTVPQGYELMDEGGIGVSDFRQRIDYQRALEGELSKTLMAMDGIEAATVRLVLPEKELFADKTEPVTASVLLNTTRPLNDNEVETVTFLVSNAVEGLDVNHITVADARGTVLHAPGDAGGASVATNRNMRQTREFEQAMAADITKLLGGLGGGTASVVVRASLNFDEQEMQSETYDPDSQVTLKEQKGREVYEGTGGAAPGGVVGVDGGPLTTGVASESNYENEQSTTEYGVDKTVERTVGAPGKVEKLSVAIVMDDGTVTGVQVPPLAEVEQLVGAAMGLEAERGDTLAVTAVPFPMVVEEEEQAEKPAVLDLATQIVAVLVLLIISLALFLMTRRRKQQEPAVTWEPAIELPDEVVLDEPAQPQRETIAFPTPSKAQQDVTSLVERQPEEIAALLRSWLADRRG